MGQIHTAMKWDKHTQLHFISAPSCRRNLLTALAQSSAHVSGDTSWDVSVSPVNEPAQEIFSAVRKASGIVLEQS